MTTLLVQYIIQIYNKVYCPVFLDKLLKQISTTKPAPTKPLFDFKPEKVKDNTSNWGKIFKSILLKEENGIPDMVNRICSSRAEDTIKILKKCNIIFSLNSSCKFKNAK